ncbi:peptidoglycan bridge formation glycyltransferase FemA/FemB family protein [Candidatus Microgenomates bacterium]|nr:peptidoglycan bridge formation glycyltransferase FemA/FemB family protein [Candidatus Microgenomates bacterium]
MAGTTQKIRLTHPLQSPAWGEFRTKTGVKVVRGDNFQITIHKLPFTSWTIGYFPKGPLPTTEMISQLKKVGRDNHCIFIQLEPNVEKISNFQFPISNLGLRPSTKPLFYQHSFVIDLTKSEEELLAAMHPKTRYNIRLAQKHGVKVEEKSDDKSFATYLKLYFETAQRQKYFGHSERFHRLMWETLQPTGIAHLLIAYYTPPSSPIIHNTDPLALTAWMLFHYGDTLYYVYGGSSSEYKNVMASNLVAWEAIKLGKKLGAKKFDLWGSLGPDADPKNPWYGFHKFKQGYGGKLVEYIGSYDLVLNPFLYSLFHLIDKSRWLILKIKTF